MSSYPTTLLHRLQIMPVDFGLSKVEGDEPQPWFPSERLVVEETAGTVISTSELPPVEEPSGPTADEILAAQAVHVEAERQAAFERGKTEALEEQELELKTVRRRYADALQKLESLTQDLAGKYQQEAVKLAARLAKTAIGANTETDPAAMQALLDRAVQGVNRPKNILIRVNPQDLSAMEEYLPQFERKRGEPISVHAMADDDIEQGGLIIETENGNVDAQPSVAVDVMREAIEARLAESPQMSRGDMNTPDVSDDLETVEVNS